MSTPIWVWRKTSRRRSRTLGQLHEGTDLVLLGHEVHELARGVDRAVLGSHHDVLRLAIHEPIADAQDGVGHGGAEEGRLPAARASRQDGLDVDDEAHVEHAVGLVQDHGVDPVQPQLAATDQVEHPSRRADHHRCPLLEGGDLALHARAAIDRHRADVAEDADAADLLGHLDAQLTGRRQHQRLHVLARWVDLFDDGNAEGGGLAGPRLRLPDQVAAGAQWTDGARLDLRWRQEAHLLDGAGDGWRELDFAEAVGLLRGQDGSQQRRVVGGCERFGRGGAVLGARGAGGCASARARRASVSFWQTCPRFYPDRITGLASLTPY